MPKIWSPPVELSPQEERIIKRCKKSRLFIFLREHRHRLFDDAFQLELAAMYPGPQRGKAIVAPAMLAMVTLLQAAMRVSDEEAVEIASLGDRRWQMVLDIVGKEDAPFSQGTLFNFRQRLIAHDLDRRLLERTVELARETRGFGHTALRAAFDASPLFGAGRVEDTFNLIGHAVREVLSTLANDSGITIGEMANRAGIPLVAGSSLKAMLDLDWDDPQQKSQGLARLIEQVDALGRFLRAQHADDLLRPPLKEQWETVQQIIAQDVEPDPSGGVQIKRGVAKERRISVRDREMRHGRKSKSSLVDGFKRHIAIDLTNGIILAAAVTPANRPEGEASPELFAGVERQGLKIVELYIDRGYLAAPIVEQRRGEGTAVHCKAFPLRNHGRFTKAAFALDFATGTVTCPAGATAPLRVGAVTHFPRGVCDVCAVRGKCTESKSGRALAIHAQEPFLAQLRATQRTPEGRADLRKRTPVEHGLAAISRTQGRRARYIGTRKNLFDLRRHAAVMNLHAAARAA